MPASLIVLGFAEGERNIAIFDHMLNLSPHYAPFALASGYLFVTLLKTRGTRVSY